MARNSKRKGNAYELKLAKELGDHWGSVFNRTPGSGAYRGAREDEMVGDIVTDPADRYPFVIEAKNREGGWTLESIVLDRHDIKNWWQQVVEDAERVDKIPLLIFTRNYAEDFVMMPYHKETHSKLMSKGFEHMITTVTYHDELETLDRTFIVLIYTLEGYKYIRKEFYLEHLSNYDWQSTEITIDDREEKTIQESANDILSMMFGDL